MTGDTSAEHAMIRSTATEIAEAFGPDARAGGGVDPADNDTGERGPRRIAGPTIVQSVEFL